MASLAWLAWIGAVVSIAAGCGGAAVEGPASPPPGEESPSVEAVAPPMVPPPEATTETATDSVVAGAIAAESEPIGVRSSRRATIVHAGPSADTPTRGAIPPRESFFIYETVDGPGCTGEGWARVGPEGYACLQRAEPTEDPPTSLPRVPEGNLVPFTYAKPRKTADGSPAIVQRWRSRHSFNAGKQPRDVLRPEASYAFVRRRSNGRKPAVLIDDHERAVPAEQMRRFRPSEFAGRDLVSDPLSDENTVVWTRIRDTAILSAPRATASVAARPQYHTQLQTKNSPIEGWFEVLDTGHGMHGFIDARHVRAWTRPPPEPRVGADELWVDVDLVRQTLTIMRGPSPIYATLVSTGKSGDATPTGLFRIYRKKALDDMQSAEGADEPYFVEAVPWAQYFHRDFALHTSYWHDLFGNRTSHGCVNLSPRDGALLYSLTSPAAPRGWNSVTESSADPGTTIRVRKGDNPVADRRAELSSTSASASE